MIDYWIISVYLEQDGSERSPDWYKSQNFRNNVLKHLKNLSPCPSSCNFHYRLFKRKHQVVITFYVSPKDIKTPFSADLFAVDMDEKIEELLSPLGLTVIKHTTYAEYMDSIDEYMRNEEDKRKQK